MELKNPPLITLTLRVLPNYYAVCQLPADSPMPQGVQKADFFSLTRTNSELSLVCLENEAPRAAKVEKAWRCFQLIGEIPFNLTGILLALLKPLAENKIGIFAISTFNTDYVLVKGVDLEPSVKALRTAGHTVEWKL